MFLPTEGVLPQGAGNRRTGASRASAPPSKWDTIKTFYYDPSKWDFIKSLAFFGFAVYMIRDLAANDLLPME